MQLDQQSVCQHALCFVKKKVYTFPYIFVSFFTRLPRVSGASQLQSVDAVHFSFSDSSPTAGMRMQGSLETDKVRSFKFELIGFRS